MSYNLRSKKKVASHPDTDAAEPHNEPPGLGRLPEELVANVVAYLPFQELASFARTCKRYQRIAYARLYYTARHDAQEYCNTWTLGHARNRELVENVREMDVDLSYVFHGRREHMDGLIANVILRDATQITKVRVKDMSSPPSAEKPWWVKHFGITDPTPESPPRNPFEHLKHLEIQSDYVPLSDISQIFRIPSLRFLQLEDTSNDGPVLGGDEALPASSCNVQKLEFHGCRLDSAIVAQILVCLRAMHWLKYDHGRPPIALDPETEPKFSWRTIGDALRKHTSTLEVLFALNMGEFQKDEEPLQESAMTTIGSLKHFEHLRTLTAPLHALRSLQDGAIRLEDYLPISLKSLTLFINPELVASTQCAATVRSAETLGLEFIRCAMPKGAPYGELQLYGALLALAESGVGIRPTLLLTKKDFFGRPLALEVLKDMEAEGYEDSEDESSEDEGSDESEEVEDVEVDEVMNEEIEEAAD